MSWLEWQAQFEGMSVLLGVDRVDYIKGIPQKLLAFEAMLTSHPELVGKVVLLQIAVPTLQFGPLLPLSAPALCFGSRLAERPRVHELCAHAWQVPEYQKVRAVAHRLVGRINGKFGSPSYVPITYLDKSIEF